MSKQGIISDHNLKIYSDYIESVSKSLEIDIPSIKFYFYLANKYEDRPRIRGGFDKKEYAIGFALNYNFKDEKDVLKTGRHEIAEWLEYIITNEVSDRFSMPHTYDPIFRKLRNAITKFYPKYPQKLVNYIRNNFSISYTGIKKYNK